MDSKNNDVPAALQRTQQQLTGIKVDEKEIENIKLKKKS